MPRGIARTLKGKLNQRRNGMVALRRMAKKGVATQRRQQDAVRGLKKLGLA